MITKNTNEKIHNRYKTEMMEERESDQLGTGDLQLIHLWCHSWHEMLKN